MNDRFTELLRLSQGHLIGFAWNFFRPVLLMDGCTRENTIMRKATLAALFSIAALAAPLAAQAQVVNGTVHGAHRGAAEGEEIGPGGRRRRRHGSGRYGLPHRRRSSRPGGPSPFPRMGNPRGPSVLPVREARNCRRCAAAHWRHVLRCAGRISGTAGLSLHDRQRTSGPGRCQDASRGRHHRLSAAPTNRPAPDPGAGHRWGDQPRPT